MTAQVINESFLAISLLHGCKNEEIYLNLDYYGKLLKNMYLF